MKTKEKRFFISYEDFIFQRLDFSPKFSGNAANNTFYFHQIFSLQVFQFILTKQLKEHKSFYVNCLSSSKITIPFENILKNYKM